MNENLIRTVYDRYTVHIFREPHTETIYERCTCQYIHERYTMPYMVSYTVPYTVSYTMPYIVRTKKTYIRIWLVNGSYRFRITVRIWSLFSRVPVWIDHHYHHKYRKCVTRLICDMNYYPSFSSKRRHQNGLAFVYRHDIRVVSFSLFERGEIHCTHSFAKVQTLAYSYFFKYVNIRIIIDNNSLHIDRILILDWLCLVSW